MPQSSFIKLGQNFPKLLSKWKPVALFSDETSSGVPGGLKALANRFRTLWWIVHVAFVMNWDDSEIKEHHTAGRHDLCGVFTTSIPWLSWKRYNATDVDTLQIQIFQWRHYLHSSGARTWPCWMTFCQNNWESNVDLTGGCRQLGACERQSESDQFC